jgi:hypothetical protein
LGDSWGKDRSKDEYSAEGLVLAEVAKLNAWLHVVAVILNDLWAWLIQSTEKLSII